MPNPDQHLDLDSIVRAVMARLEGHSALEEKAAQSAADFADVVTQRVVTLEIVQTAVASGKKELRVPVNAIVTPAARDFLQSSGIAWTRGLEGASSPRRAESSQRQTIVMGIALRGRIDLRALAFGAAQSGWTIAPGNVQDDVASGVRQIAESVARGARVCCLTEAPSLVLCAANRLPELRAVGANCACCVRDAANRVGANVLVANPQGKTPLKIQELLRAFARCEEECPSEAAAVLRSMVSP